MNAIRLLLLCLLQCSVSLAFAQATAANPSTVASAAAAEKTVEVNRAAKVVLVEGDVAVMSSAKKRRTPAVGEYLVEGDSIVTGKDGELHLDMEDGGYISVRPNTRMRIVKYSAKGETTDSGVFGLLEGSFRSVTGWIGKFNGKNYTVRTPTATVGIRGTDHEPYVIPKGSKEGEPGTYDKVNEGGSYIQTTSGRADIGANQSGFVSHDKAAKPRLLKDIPAHFRAGRNERLFAGKHAEVQSRIEKRREDRRSEIREKLQKGKSEAESRRKQRQDAVKEKREQKAEAKAEAKAEKKQDGTRAEQRKARIEEKQEQKKAHDRGEHARRRGD
ncbi:MAG: FecR domain-containing protein [Betaproteobacteria bacterium]|nr:FecR domain-containing protein [Betaproteobacteria bacterium]